MESLKIGRLVGPGAVLRATRRRYQIERIGSQRSDASLAVASYPEYGIAILDAARRSRVPTDSNLRRDTTLLSLDVRYRLFGLYRPRVDAMLNRRGSTPPAGSGLIGGTFKEASIIFSVSIRSTDQAKLQALVTEIKHNLK